MGSHDKSIRVWEKLDEPLFLEEEREKELEEIYERGIADTLNQQSTPIGPNPDETLTEVAMVSKQTTETLMAGERIIEALDLADGEREAFRQHEEAILRLSKEDAMKLQPPPRNPILAAYELEPEAWVLRVVEKIASTALQDALLVLPFGKVVSLMQYLNIWTQKVGNRLFEGRRSEADVGQNWNIPLVSRIVFFLLKTHHHQIVANRIMRTSLIPLRKHLRAALQREKEMMGYNLAALHYLRQRNDHERTAQFFEEEQDEEQVHMKISEGKKRKRVNLKA
ncbi:hypothetical protein MPER_11954 [Moniliophthora perniciosa FA553]|nr:hypothetical protein MPER_11954 [Moniliophthora perniciosa FA553]